jgi:beta-glucosidase
MSIPLNRTRFLVLSTLLIATVTIAEEASSNKPSKRQDSVEAELERLLAQLTLEEKVSLCHANSKFAIAGVERLGIQEMWMSDGPHGVREEISRDSWSPAGWDNDHATYLPPLTAVAASFNPEMATLHGSVLGAEARERKKDVILGPGVNLARLPLYGRNFEYLGEDPYMASKMVVPEIVAIQKNDVAACVKHYALNTQELNRHGVNAKPDERTLREIYLPAFEAAIKEAGVLTVMGSYNEFRGTNCNQSKHLVMDILKGEWGFKGLLMTDWDCDINTMDAAMNGLDIEMGTRKPSYDEYFLAKPFLDLLKRGKIPMEVLDDKVRRILRVQLTIGMMDPNRKPGKRATDDHFAKARRIIEEGVVLLKNDKLRLPLQRDNIKSVLVMGPTLICSTVMVAAHRRSKHPSKQHRWRDCEESLAMV